MTSYTNFYADGTIQLFQNNNIVEGTGTLWLQAGVEGGVLFIMGQSYPVLEVLDDTHLRIIQPWVYTTTAPGLTYSIGLMDSKAATAIAANQKLMQLIDLYSNQPGHVIGFNNLEPTADRLGYFTGPETMALTGLTGFGRSIIAADSAANGRATLEINDLGLGAPSIALTNANNAQLGSMLQLGGTENEAVAANLPALGEAGNIPRWWNLLTFGVGGRTTQIAQEVYGQGVSPKGRIFTRVNHDVWQPWQEVYTARDEPSRLLKSWGPQELANASVLLFDLPTTFSAFEIVATGLYSNAGSIVSIRLGGPSSSGQAHGLHAANYEISLVQTSGGDVTAVNAVDGSEFAISLTRAVGDNVSRTLISPGSPNNHPTMNVNFSAGSGSSFFISIRAGRLLVPERMTRIGILSTAVLSSVGNIRIYGVN